MRRILFLLLMFFLANCSSQGNYVVFSRETPNEFLVIKNKSLSIPPDIISHIIAIKDNNVRIKIDKKIQHDKIKKHSNLTSAEIRFFGRNR